MADPAAVVLLSGGLDSSVLLAIARAEGFGCRCLSVDYGQRHRAELDAAGRVARALGAVQHKVLKVDLSAIGGSALTDPGIPVPERPTDGIPVTYVPPAIPSCFPSRSRGPRCWARPIFSSVRMRSTTPAIRTAGRSISTPTRRWRTSPPRPRSRAGRSRCTARSSTSPRRRSFGAAPISESISARPCRAIRRVRTSRACGRCDACRLRRAGFEAARLPIPTRYAA